MQLPSVCRRPGRWRVSVADYDAFLSEECNRCRRIAEPHFVPGRLGEGGLALDAAGRGGQRILTSPVDFSNSVERSGEPGDGAAAVAR